MTMKLSALPVASIRHALGLLAVTILLMASVAINAGAQSVRPPANATNQGAPPVGPNVVAPDKPGNFDLEMWKKVRSGLEGQVSIPDKKAGVLVQSGGETWRNLRNGPLVTYGAWGMGGILAILALFYFVRGPIKLSHGWSGRTIERFGNLERASHWLMAVSFIILGLTGLNILYGRYVLLPIMGKDLFADLTGLGKWAHNYVAFAFMVGLALSFVMWVKHNFPNKYDLIWLKQGGGMFSKGAHPPAKKFNAGQKILFWLVMLGGLSISLSGLAMMFPFQMPMFAKTFAWLNVVGFGLPTVLSPVQEMQYATTWHGIMGIFLVAVILGHIYIGTVGMQGAFDAMGSGQVDVAWAKEHHSVWAAEVLANENTGRSGMGRGGLAAAGAAATVAAVAQVASGVAPTMSTPRAGVEASARTMLPANLKPVAEVAKPGDVLPLPQFARQPISNG